MAKRRAKKNEGVASFMFYGLTPLGYEYRTQLSRISDPYSGSNALEVLKKLGAIYYRDNKHSAGLLIKQPALTDVWTPEGFIVDEPFCAYVYQATCRQEGNALVVRDRSLQGAYTPTDLNMKNQRIGKYGDNLWWDRWASVCQVKAVTPFTVQRG